LRLPENAADRIHHRPGINVRRQAGSEHQASGEILDGSCSLQETGQRIFELMLKTAPGERSKREFLGLGGSPTALLPNTLSSRLGSGQRSILKCF